MQYCTVEYSTSTVQYLGFSSQPPGRYGTYVYCTSWHRDGLYIAVLYYFDATAVGIPTYVYRNIRSIA